MFFSRIRSWLTQRIASVGLAAILLLTYLALGYDRPSLVPPSNASNASTPLPAEDQPTRGLTKAQVVFVCYTIAAHVLALVFPIRLCWTTYSLTKRLCSVGVKQVSNLRPRRRSMKEIIHQDDGYEASISSFAESSSSSVYSESTDYCSSEREKVSDIVLHTIIVPNYEEELDTLRETLEVLACHIDAKNTYEICLAMEQAEDGARAKAMVLVNEYASRFRNVDFTIHPKGVEGEAQGKSSNLCWAAKYVNGKCQEEKQNMIITVVDSDSHLSASYFESINEMHRQYPQTAGCTLYVPPIIFDRNAHLVPTLVRVADILWLGAGMSGHSSAICPPTSVYSLPLALVNRVGGWDAGGDAIGEDLHMYIKCFFALNGNLKTRTVLSAASHSNVHTGFPGIRGFYRDLRARYSQAFRHMWGALDSGFVLKSTSNMWWGGHEKDRPHWTNTLILFHRMYEAHFLPTHLTLLIVSGGLYNLFTPAVLVHPTLLRTFSFTGFLRLGSAVLFGVFFYLYEEYHMIAWQVAFPIELPVIGSTFASFLLQVFYLEASLLWWSWFVIFGHWIWFTGYLRSLYLGQWQWWLPSSALLVLLVCPKWRARGLCFHYTAVV